MNRNNRYCCLFMPCEIAEKCNYFELDLQIKNLKKIVHDINNELNTNFLSSQALIDDKYGILFFDNTNVENQYITKLGKINKKGNCLLICHIANFDEFIKTQNLNIYDDKFLKYISHNSILCRKMIFLCIYYITENYNLEF